MKTDISTSSNENSSASLSAAPAAHALELGAFNDADTNYEAHRVNLIHNITQDLEAGIEWRKYNFAFGPLLPEGQQVEVMAKYKF